MFYIYFKVPPAQRHTHSNTHSNTHCTRIRTHLLRTLRCKFAADWFYSDSPPHHKKRYSGERRGINSYTQIHAAESGYWTSALLRRRPLDHQQLTQRQRRCQTVEMSSAKMARPSKTVALSTSPPDEQTMNLRVGRKVERRNDEPTGR